MSEVHVIEWLDAVADTGWKAHADAEPCQAVASVGLLVAEDDTRVVLAGSWGLNDGTMETNNRMTIPKGWITGRTVLDPAALRVKSALKDLRQRGKKPATSTRQSRKSFK